MSQSIEFDHLHWQIAVKNQENLRLLKQNRMLKMEARRHFEKIQQINEDKSREIRLIQQELVAKEDELEVLGDEFDNLKRQMSILTEDYGNLMEKLSSEFVAQQKQDVEKAVFEMEQVKNEEIAKLKLELDKFQRQVKQSQWIECRLQYHLKEMQAIKDENERLKMNNHQNNNSNNHYLFPIESIAGGGEMKKQLDEPVETEEMSTSFSASRNYFKLKRVGIFKRFNSVSLFF